MMCSSALRAHVCLEASDAPQWVAESHPLENTSTSMEHLGEEWQNERGSQVKELNA
jgi:hypothetical protein